MTTTIIAYFPSPPRGVWHLGPVPIRAYALFIIVGIVAALLIGDRRWAARGGERGVIYDIALWAVPFGLIGGRLYHLATDWRTYFGEGGAGPGAALRIWDGGLGIWGAVALGLVGAWIACRRRGIPLPAFSDAMAPGIVLAQAIGRLGNYFNQELFGRETTLPWGLEIFYRRDPAGFVDVHSLDGVSTGQLAMVVQPTFLYELLWNLAVFAALIYLDRRFTIGHGRLFALYVAGYCVGRFCIELLRDDAATHIAGIRINSFTSTFVFIGGVVYFILAPKGREDPATLSGSAAELLAPDSVEEAETVSLPSAAAAVDTQIGSAETTEMTTAELTAVDEPETEAVAVAEEAASAEVDAPEVEVAAGAEQLEPTDAEAEPTAVDEPDTEGAAVAEEAAAAEVDAPEVEVAEAEEEGEPEAAGELEPADAEAESPEGDAAESAESDREVEPETTEPEHAEAAEVDAPEVEVAEAEEEGEPEPADAEAESPEGDAAESAESESDAEPQTAESEITEPETAEDANAKTSEDEKPSDAGAAAALVSDLPLEPTGSIATRWGSRLKRLNPRLRR